MSGIAARPKEERSPASTRAGKRTPPPRMIPSAQARDIFRGRMRVTKRNAPLSSSHSTTAPASIAQKRSARKAASVPAGESTGLAPAASGQGGKAEGERAGRRPGPARGPHRAPCTGPGTGRGTGRGTGPGTGGDTGRGPARRGGRAGEAAGDGARPGRPAAPQRNRPRRAPPTNQIRAAPRSGTHHGVGHLRARPLEGGGGQLGGPVARGAAPARAGHVDPPVPERAGAQQEPREQRDDVLVLHPAAVERDGRHEGVAALADEEARIVGAAPLPAGVGLPEVERVWTGTGRGGPRPRPARRPPAGDASGARWAPARGA